MAADDRPVSLLLVEDDAIDVMTVERILRKQNIANPLFVARDGVEALEMLRGIGRDPVPKPYLILLDLNMPRMDGLEFLAELREDPDHHRAPVFVLTTSDASEDRAAAHEHRVAGYIVKDRMGDDLLDLLIIQSARAVQDWKTRDVDVGRLIRGAIQRLRILDGLKVALPADLPWITTAEKPLEYVFLTLLGHITRRQSRPVRLDVAWEDTGSHLRFNLICSGRSGLPADAPVNLRERMAAGPLSDQDAETVGLVVTRNLVEGSGGSISLSPSGAACAFSWPRSWPEHLASAPPLGQEPPARARVDDEPTQAVQSLSLRFEPPEHLKGEPSDPQ